AIGLTFAAPVATNQAYSVLHDDVLSIGPDSGGVLSDDSNPSGNSLTAALVQGPSHGTLDLAGDGSFTYAPGAGFAGTDSFTYRVSDGIASSNTATVTIDVTDTAPVASAASFSTQHDRPLLVEAGWLLAQPGDNTDALTEGIP